MGSFAGHIDEGVASVVLAFWWMYKIYKHYIQSLQKDVPYISYCSYYTLFRGRRIPFEIILKTFVPVAGILGEVIYTDSFIDKYGHFQNINRLMHISIFSLFVIHGVTDFLEYLRVPAIKGLKYFTFSIAFIWYGVAFYFHSMPGMGISPLERKLHRLLVPLLILTGSVLPFEYAFRNSIIPQIVRCFCVLCLGVWVILTSFVLFLPTPFPGFRGNPAWDRNEMSNVHFMEVAFGFMLAFNIALMIVLYILMALWMKYGRGCLRKRQFSKHEYKPLLELEMDESCNPQTNGLEE